MFSRGTFTLARVEEVLAAIELDPAEVARMTRAGAAPRELTEEQELALAKDERLLAIFWASRSMATISRTSCRTTPSRAPSHAGVRAAREAQAHPVGSGRTRQASSPATSRGARAARRRRPARRAMAEFLHARFDGALELLHFESCELSPESAAAMNGKLKQLVAEFKERAEADSSSRRAAASAWRSRRCRPWEFSAVNALKRRSRSA